MSLLREIKHHQISHEQDNNNRIKIHSIDAPGPGGAHHLYSIDLENGLRETQTVSFQNGTVPDNGVNGITIEALLALCIDRLECFQSGAFANSSNQEALNHLNQAMDALKERTLDRINRNVKGAMVK